MYVPSTPLNQFPVIRSPPPPPAIQREIGGSESTLYNALAWCFTFSNPDPPHIWIFQGNTNVCCYGWGGGGGGDCIQYKFWLHSTVWPELFLYFTFVYRPEFHDLPGHVSTDFFERDTYTTPLSCTAWEDAAAKSLSCVDAVIQPSDTCQYILEPPTPLLRPFSPMLACAMV